MAELDPIFTKMEPIWERIAEQHRRVNRALWLDGKPDRTLDEVAELERLVREIAGE